MMHKHNVRCPPIKRNELYISLLISNCNVPFLNNSMCNAEFASLQFNVIRSDRLRNNFEIYWGGSINVY